MIAICGIGIGVIFFVANGDSEAAEETTPPTLQSKRALETIEKLCSFGPRLSGSEGMKNQQEWLRSQFSKLGGQIEWQEFPIRHPETGETVQIKNMIIKFGPQSTDRLLIVAHYDTRPFPDLDPVNPRGKFVGANDGASGPALMLELAHTFHSRPPNIGVDFVLFDAEEFVFKEGDEYFLGSSYFARSYLMKDSKVPAYRAGVLVDMIADKNLELYYELNSLRYARSLTERFGRSQRS